MSSGADVVQVEFEDTPGETYSYKSGGLKLEVGDLVVTPAPSSAGRFGYQRYNKQGIAAVVALGRGTYNGPFKTLLGKITTKSGKTKKARWYRESSSSLYDSFRAQFFNSPIYPSEISGSGYARAPVKEPNTKSLPPVFDRIATLEAQMTRKFSWTSRRISRLENRSASVSALIQLRTRFEELQKRIEQLEEATVAQPTFRHDESFVFRKLKNLPH